MTVERKTSFHTSSVQVWLATTQELLKIQEEGGAEEGAQGGYSRFQDRRSTVFGGGDSDNALVLGSALPRRARQAAMSANPNHPEDDALPSTSSDTRGLIDGGEGPSTRNKTVRQRSSIEADSDDEIHDDGARGGAHPFQAAPEYRDAILRHLNEHT